MNAMQTPTARRLLSALLLATVAMVLPAGPVAAQEDRSFPSGTLTLQRDPNDPSTLLNRYLRMLSSDPRNLEALLGAGRATLAMGDANAAIGFFGRAEGVAPANGRVKAGLAAAAVQQEQPRQALRLFDQAVAAGVPVAEIAGDRGLAYDLRGQPRQAQADYRTALAAARNDEIVRRLALSTAIDGDRAGAMRILDPLLRRQDKAAWRAATFVLAMTGDSTGAIRRANQLMIPSQAAAMTPYLQRLGALTAAEKAAAVHFGRFPAAPRPAGTQVAAAAVPQVGQTGLVGTVARGAAGQAYPPGGSTAVRPAGAASPGGAAALVAVPAQNVVAARTGHGSEIQRAATVPLAGGMAQAAGGPAATAAPAAGVMAASTQGTLPARTPVATPLRAAGAMPPIGTLPSAGVATASAAPVAVPAGAVLAAVSGPAAGVSSDRGAVPALSPTGVPAMSPGAVRVAGPAAGGSTQLAMLAAGTRSGLPMVAATSTAAPAATPPAGQTGAVDALDRPTGDVVPMRTAGPAVVRSPETPVAAAADVRRTAPGSVRPVATPVVSIPASVSRPVTVSIAPPAPVAPVAARHHDVLAGPARPQAAKPAVDAAELPVLTAVQKTTLGIRARGDVAVASLTRAQKAKLAASDAADAPVLTAAQKATLGIRTRGNVTLASLTPTQTAKLTAADAADPLVLTAPQKTVLGIRTKGDVAVASLTRVQKAKLAALDDADAPVLTAAQKKALGIRTKGDVAVASLTRAQKAKLAATDADDAPVLTAAQKTVLGIRTKGDVALANLTRAQKVRLAAPDAVDAPVLTAAQKAMLGIRTKSDVAVASLTRAQKAKLAASDEADTPVLTAAQKTTLGIRTKGDVAVASLTRAQAAKLAAAGKGDGAAGGKNKGTAPERHWVQIAGGANKATLPKAFAGVKAQYPALLGGRSGWTTPLRFTNRLLIGPFASDDEAQAFVNKAGGAGLNAFTYTSAAGVAVEKLPTR